MLQNHLLEMRQSGAISALCISWILEDNLAFAPALRAKLAVPTRRLIPALAALTPPELRELKSGISDMASNGALPGPMRLDELFDFLNSLSNTHPQRSQSDKETK